MNIKNIILVLVLVGVSFFIFNMKTGKQAPVPNEQEQVVSVMGPNKEDLLALSIAPGSTVTGEFVLEGIVKNAYFFEGNISIDLLDANQNLLKVGYGTATTDWMTVEPVTFTANLDATGLTGPGYIKIQNDDPSDGEGGPAKIILVPVVFQ
ncbi:MAG TPA: Gmad2 immunoglobulin-like domain-containing protein [Candidatus Paceibacterota bacterium]|nr:Gmad2 immunoglobulin-like domain-containing protein [Candidatus Paceibacterota bacterium]